MWRKTVICKLIIKFKKKYYQYFFFCSINLFASSISKKYIDSNIVIGVILVIVSIFFLVHTTSLSIGPKINYYFYAGILIVALLVFNFILFNNLKDVMPFNELSIVKI